jgi:hypothetical protein
MPRENLFVSKLPPSKLPPPQLLHTAAPGKKRVCETFHDSDRNVPVQTTSSSSIIQTNLFYKKSSLRHKTHFETKYRQTTVRPFSKFSKPNNFRSFQTYIGNARGRIRACAIHETTVYSGKNISGTPCARKLYMSCKKRQSRASLLACFLVLKLKNKTANRIKVTKM